MVHRMKEWLVPLALIVVMGLAIQSIEAIEKNKNLKTATFLSPMFSMTPGLAMERFYYNIDFPRGHLAMKAFDAEVVDEDGNSVPLYDTYLHHWTVVRYYQHKDIPEPDSRIPYCDKLREPGFIVAGSLGTCQTYALPQFYGIGSETRKTSTYVPDPYAIELGNPAAIPEGFEEKWVLNVHAIDSRGAEDTWKCIECWCDAYNNTVDQYGNPLEAGYKGGMKCCYDKLQCRLRKDYDGSWEKRNLFMKYTVTYLDWEDTILPVKVYLLDITDSWTLSKPHNEHNCVIEYSVEACHPTNKPDDRCLATKRVQLVIPSGGYLVYGSAHQHIGGIGTTVYGEDGRVLCSSTPIYGDGHEAGNEKGYIVGMTSCYPKPGSLKVKDGEVVTFESNYEPGETHIGVMGVFNIMVSDKLPPSILMEPSEFSASN